MDTATQAETADRELTKTERDIVVAQICDRLERLSKATRRYIKHQANCDTAEECKTAADSARIQYNIPSDVYLFGEGESGIPFDGRLKEFKAYARAFTSGQMSDGDFDALCFFCEEIDEFDWGWVFMETPFGYYNTKPEADTERGVRITKNLRKVATRSSKKATLPKLPHLFEEVTS